MLNNFESELLHHQHHNFVKRPLIEKKVINLFLEISKVILFKKQR